MTVLDRLALEAIELAERNSQARVKPRAILGIAGNPGAGKSTLVELLMPRIAVIKGDQWIAHVPMDGFHLADSQLDRLGNRDRKGAPDTFDVLGYAHLLERIAQEDTDPVYAPGFDRTLEQPLAGALVVLPSARLVITEGNYLLLDDPRWVRAREAMDAVWFVASEEALRVERLVERHVRFGKNARQARAWVAGTDQVNAELVSTTLPRADRVVVNDSAGWTLA
ncbi:nucleoside/nucleotide kinase family protein [Mycobacterium sp. URHB0021]